MTRGSASPRGSSPARSGLSDQRHEVLAQLDSPGAVALPPPGWHQAMPTCQAARSWHCVTAAFAPSHKLDGSSSSPSLAGVTSAQPGAGALPGVPSLQTTNTVTSSAASGQPYLPHTKQQRCLQPETASPLSLHHRHRSQPIVTCSQVHGRDHVRHVHTTTGTPSATAGGHPPYPRCCPPCAPLLGPKGGNGAPLASVFVSNCPQQGMWSCLSTPAPPQVLWW